MVLYSHLYVRTSHVTLSSHCESLTEAVALLMCKMTNLAFSSSYSSVSKMLLGRSWNQTKLYFDRHRSLHPNLPFKVLMVVSDISVQWHEGVSLLRSPVLRSGPGIEGNLSFWYQTLHENILNVMTFLWRLFYWLVFRKRSGVFIMAWIFIIYWLVANLLCRVVKCVCPFCSWSWALQLHDMESPDHPLMLNCTDWRQFKQSCCFVLSKIK